MDPSFIFVAVLLAAWGAGVSLGIGGALIHLLLAFVLVVLLLRVVQTRPF